MIVNVLQVINEEGIGNDDQKQQRSENLAKNFVSKLKAKRQGTKAIAAIKEAMIQKVEEFKTRSRSKGTDS